jgi:hypothetical protein
MGASVITRPPAIEWRDWPGAIAFEDAARAQYRAIAGTLLARAAVPWDWQIEPCGRALMDALITGRRFSFWRVDTVDRVRMRNEWEHLRQAIALETKVTNCAEQVTQFVHKVTDCGMRSVSL